MSDPADPFQLSRFVEAQADAHETALAELRAGRKTSHWIWYVFPQLAGLGRSGMSARYGLSGLAEAVAFLAHPVLGARLHEAVQAVLTHPGVSPAAILGELDAMKLRSCLTLFNLAAPEDPLFAEAIARLFDGQQDPVTVRLLVAGRGPR